MCKYQDMHMSQLILSAKKNTRFIKKHNEIINCPKSNCTLNMYTYHLLSGIEKLCRRKILMIIFKIPHVTPK